MTDHERSVISVAAARELAQQHLAQQLPRRWQHVQAVAAEAAHLAGAIDLDADTLVCAAWLHDIGYSVSISDSGFHPLDGARFLRRHGWPGPVCDLVAHHSCARVEAQVRGLGRELLLEFADTPGSERDALWTADATTGPDGQRMTLDQRVREVEERYGRDHRVARCMQHIRPELEAAITRTHVRSIAAARRRTSGSSAQGPPGSAYRSIGHIDWATGPAHRYVRPPQLPRP